MSIFGKIVVLKSTIFPGMTEKIQEEFPDRIIMHSPEFLTEATAAFDASRPDRNIIGIPKNNKNFINKAKLVLSVLPKAPYNKICSAKEAELVKYGGNCFFYTKVIFMNLLYDLASKKSVVWFDNEGGSSDPIEEGDDKFIPSNASCVSLEISTEKTWYLLPNASSIGFLS